LSTEVRNDSHSEFVTASKNSNDDRQLNLTEEQDTSEPRLKTEGANFKLIFLSLMLDQNKLECMEPPSLFNLVAEVNVTKKFVHNLLIFVKS
jgi:hypothetical protein